MHALAALTALCGAVAVALVVPALVWLWRRARPRPGAQPRRPRPLDDDVGELDEDLAIRLLVLKAHVLGRRLAGTESGLLLADLEAAHGALDYESATDGALRRHSFVAMLGAEIDRTQGIAVSWRRRAKEIGAAMADRGTLDPYPLHLAVSEATTRAVDTGYFGDITRTGATRVRVDEVAAAGRLQLDRGVVHEHRDFVFGDDLQPLLARMAQALPESARRAGS